MLRRVDLRMVGALQVRVVLMLGSLRSVLKRSRNFVYKVR
jgi:hypothetical protein